MKKILVINTKGGVGKTTASVELFAPYLFLNNDMQKVGVYSFDEENFLNSFYESSEILFINSHKVNNVDMEDKLGDIILEQKPIVIDVGANKTTTITLKALENTGLIHAFDIIAIPITDGEQDVLNAKSVYNSIKRMDKQIQVVFVLSRYVQDRDLFLQFESFFEELHPILQEKDKYYIPLKDSDAIKHAKKARKTVYELSFDRTDFDTQIQSMLEKNGPKEEILSLSKQKRAMKTAMDFRVDTLSNGFEILTKIGRKDEK